MKILSTFFMLFSFVYFLGAQEIDYSEESFAVQSSVLDEERNITIYFPNEKTEDLIALYVLDGNWNYELVKGTIAHWVRWGLIPDVVVVSIDNMGVRTRDMTPTPDEVRFPGSGGAETFLRFVAEELKPMIQNRFSTIQSDILFGHSFGGLFTLYTLKELPALFDSYIAVSPSVWWKDRFMYGTYDWDGLTKMPFVYTTAGTNDRGNTSANNEYVSWMIDQNYNASIELYSDTFEGEDHFTNVPITLHYGLSKFFPKQKWADLALTVFEKSGLEVLKDSVSRWKSDFGIRYDLPNEALLNKSHEIFQKGAFEKSVALLIWLAEQRPENYMPLYYLASFHEEAQPEKSLDYYKKALHVGGMPDRMKVVIERKIEELK